MTIFFFFHFCSLFQVAVQLRWNCRKCCAIIRVPSLAKSSCWLVPSPRPWKLSQGSCATMPVSMQPTFSTNWDKSMPKVSWNRRFEHVIILINGDSVTFSYYFCEMSFSLIDRRPTCVVCARRAHVDVENPCRASALIVLHISLL